MLQPHSAGALVAGSGGCSTENCRILISAAIIAGCGEMSAWWNRVRY